MSVIFFADETYDYIITTIDKLRNDKNLDIVQKHEELK